jgi:tyrosine-protein kinase Etk/Wzc
MATQTSSSEHQPMVSASPERSGLSSREGKSLVEFLTVLAEQRTVVLLVTAGFLASSILLAFLLPQWYTATVTLLPPQQSSSLSSAMVSQLGNMGGLASLAGGSGLGLKSQNEMYVGMLKSRTVEDAMVQKFGLMKEYRKRYLSDARKAFERHASVDGAAKDGLIHLSIEARDPARAAALANGYVDQFRSLSEHLAITEASQRRLFFERQLEQAKDNLANAEEALKETELRTGLIQLDSQARALIESASLLRAQIAAKEVEIESMRTFATEENAQLVQAQQQLTSLRAQLAKLGGSGENSEASLLVPKGRVPQAGLEYVRKLRDVKYYETIFEILAKQFEAAKLDEAKQGAVIQIVGAAVPPDKRSFPKRAWIIVGGTLFGFVIAVIFVYFRESFERLKGDPDVMEQIDGLRRAVSRRKLRV